MTNNQFDYFLATFCINNTQMQLILFEAKHTWNAKVEAKHTWNAKVVVKYILRNDNELSYNLQGKCLLNIFYIIV